MRNAIFAFDFLATNANLENYSFGVAPFMLAFGPRSLFLVVLPSSPLHPVLKPIITMERELPKWTYFCLLFLCAFFVSLLESEKEPKIERTRKRDVFITRLAWECVK